MTNKCVWLLSALILSIPAFGQLELLAEWPLNSTSVSNPLPSTDLQASIFRRGNGVSGITYSTSGARASYWPTESNAEAVDYYEVCITPDPGITLQVSQLEFSESRTANGTGAFEVHWSTDDFSTSHQIFGQVIPDNTDERKHTLSNLDIDICNGNTLCFRWYGYRAEENGGEWKFGSNSLKISGQRTSVCAPPTSVGTLSFSTPTTSSLQVHLTPGNGSGRVVVMREGSAVSPSTAPCNGISYNASNVFGLGDQLAPGEFVVYSEDGAINFTNTDFTVTGLLDGATYHFAVFEYNGTCYQQQSFVSGTATTNCGNPNLVRQLLYSGTDSKISLMWDPPYCFDDILVVGGYAPITGFPTGDGSQYTVDPIFGNGDGGSDFGANEFPLFLGTANHFDVTSVQNNNIYHLTFYVRKGSTWVEAKRVSAMPLQGCSELNGDNLFINEVEYLTHQLDMDEGIELAGVAGVNLEAYEIHVYYFIPTDSKKAKTQRIIPLSGTIEDQQNGMGAVWVPIPEIENLHGFAIYNKVTQTVAQFLSFLRPLEAIDGVANGLIADQTLAPDFHGNISNVLEHSNSNRDKTMQLFGSGSCPSDFTWVNETPQTRGYLNSTQAFVPLPIELISFSAKAVEEKVLLSWQTLTEVNNDYMAIEHSLEGKDFKEIGLVKGAGTTFEPQSYTLWDVRPNPGINYYRLRQVDYDGTTTYSDMVSVIFDGKGWGVKVFPSLAQDFVTVQLDQATAADGVVRIFDLNGQLRQQQVLAEGSLSLGINIAHLNPGQFIVQIERAEGVSVQRITKF